MSYPLMILAGLAAPVGCGVLALVVCCAFDAVRALGDSGRAREGWRAAFGERLRQTSQSSALRFVGLFMLGWLCFQNVICATGIALAAAFGVAEGVGFGAGIGVTAVIGAVALHRYSRRRSPHLADPCS